MAEVISLVIGVVTVTKLPAEADGTLRMALTARGCQELIGDKPVRRPLTLTAADGTGSMLNTIKSTTAVTETRPPSTLLILVSIHPTFTHSGDSNRFNAYPLIVKCSQNKYSELIQARYRGFKPRM